MDYLRAVGEWIYHFQTLLAGVLALLAAWWTVKHIRKQLKQSEKQRIEDKTAKNISARAGLPKSISEIVEYANNCLAINFEIFQHWKTNNDLGCFVPKKKLPEYPIDAFNVVQSIIATADEGDATVLVDFINWAQVHRSRILSYFPSPTNLGAAQVYMLQNFHSSFFDTLVLKQYAYRVFPYARNQRTNIGGFCDTVALINNFTIDLTHTSADEGLLNYLVRRWPPKGLSETKRHKPAHPDVGREP